MSLIGLLILLIVVIGFGVLLWIVQSLPIQQPFRTAAYVLLLLIFLLFLLGILSGGGYVSIPRIVVR